MAAVSSDTVFLLGAGTIENAWDPIIDAIQEHRSPAHVRTPDQANHYLAWWVYGQRLRARRMEMEKGSISPQLKEKLDEIARDDLRLRKAMAEHLSKATADGSYRLRRKFVEVAAPHRWDKGGGVLYLSTNWDHLFENAMAIPPKGVLHIHGDVGDHSCIYLPSETSHEAHRSPEANKKIGALTGTAWRAIEGTHQLCIYGLSLSPLDAELSWILQVGLEAHTRETLRIHLFNCGAELDKIEWRIRLLLPPGSTVEIEKHAVD